MSNHRDKKVKPRKGSSNLIHNLDPKLLYYFWEVVRYKTQNAAAEATTIGQPELSNSIHKLDEQLTELTGRHIETWQEVGNRNVLTKDGELVYQYAQEMMRALHCVPLALGSKKFTVGITAAFPKYLSYFILRELLNVGDLKLRLVSVGLDEWEEKLDNGECDLVLADGPIPEPASLRMEKAYVHREGQTHPIIVADERLIKARNLRDEFPQSLNNVPFIMPPPNSTLAKALLAWFAENGITPDIIAESNDRLLMVLLAQNGTAVIGISSVVAPPVCELQNLAELDRITNTKFRENFFAVALKRPTGEPWAVRRVLELIDVFSKTPPKADWGVGKLHT